MFRTITFERRMNMYITLTLLLVAFTLVFSIMMKAEQSAYVVITPVHMGESNVSLMNVDEVEEVKTIPLAEIDTIELDPDDYDGKIVIATAHEIITMTIDEGGVKHFTNHLIG